MNKDSSDFATPADKAASADRHTPLSVFKRIYLGPSCAQCQDEDRMWCEDDQGPCECGLEWIAYDLAPLSGAP